MVFWFCLETIANNLIFLVFIQLILRGTQSLIELLWMSMYSQPFFQPPPPASNDSQLTLYPTPESKKNSTVSNATKTVATPVKNRSPNNPWPANNFLTPIHQPHPVLLFLLLKNLLGLQGNVQIVVRRAISRRTKSIAPNADNFFFFFLCSTTDIKGL